MNSSYGGDGRFTGHAGSKIDTGDTVGIDVEKIIRSGIERFSDQRGKLWAGLATYWIMRKNFEKARMYLRKGSRLS